MAISSRVLCILVLACAVSCAFGTVETEDSATTGRGLLGWKSSCKGRKCGYGHNYGYKYGGYYHTPSKAKAKAHCYAYGPYGKCLTHTKAIAKPYLAKSSSLSHGRTYGSSATAKAGALAVGKGAVTKTKTNAVVTHGGSYASSQSFAKSGGDYYHG